MVSWGCVCSHWNVSNTQESFFYAVCGAALKQFLSKASAKFPERLAQLVGEMIQRLKKMNFTGWYSVWHFLVQINVTEWSCVWRILAYAQPIKFNSLPINIANSLACCWFPFRAIDGGGLMLILCLRRVLALLEGLSDPNCFMDLVRYA